MIGYQASHNGELKSQLQNRALQNNHIVNQLHTVTNAWRRSGASRSRSKEFKKLIYAVKNIAQHDKNIRDVRNLGSKQVVSFYKRHDNLGFSTKMKYFYELRRLFDALFSNFSSDYASI